MNIHEHTTPEMLVRYAFLWSLARLVIAAFSLFFGATPIIYHVMGFGNMAMSLLPLFWLISGVASIYLLYRWYKAGMTVFGGKDAKDMVFFLIMVVTGLNLGYAAIGTNLGMGMVWDVPVAALIFKATALLYLAVAYMMWKGWTDHNESLFEGGAAVVPTMEAPATAPTKRTSN